MRSLDVWREAEFVGRFTLGDTGSVSFEYDSHDGLPISLSLPRHGQWSRHAPHRFLENLLPDRPQARLQMAAQNQRDDPGGTARNHARADYRRPSGEQLRPIADCRHDGRSTQPRPTATRRTALAPGRPERSSCWRWSCATGTHSSQKCRRWQLAWTPTSQKELAMTDRAPYPNARAIKTGLRAMTSRSHTLRVGLRPCEE
ncbi:MAG: HipA N-terminal domain-containing protein [Propionibacteriaceae bacterium]|nr:HipA N-terminal domain-containing protein [Propionibacteriaceae bacterium]